MEFFYFIKKKDTNYKIIPKNDNNYDNSIAIKYNDIINKTLNKIKTNFTSKYLFEKYDNILYKNKYYLWGLLNFDIDNSISILSDDFTNEFYISKHSTNIGKVDKVNKKFLNIHYKLSDKLNNVLLKYDYCKKEELLHDNKIKIISYLFNFLENGGSFFISFYGFCNQNTIEILNILILMFDEIIIYNSFNVLCKKFNPVIHKNDIEKIMSNKYTIQLKENLDKLILYFNKNLKYQTSKLQLLLDDKESELLTVIKDEVMDSFKSYKVAELNDFKIDYNKYLIENFKSIFVNNNIIKTTSAIKGTEGNYLQYIINKYNYTNCLEVGCANGVSGFYILTANKNTRLISVDPYQSTQWHNNGINMFKYFNLDNRHTLYEEKSYECLPRLINKYANTFDLIFIDGFHTFDYTLIDFFYSNLLLKKNGIIIIDDALHKGVSKCVKYIETNYNSFYKKLTDKTPITFAAFRKINDDTREWNFHVDF